MSLMKHLLGSRSATQTSRSRRSRTAALRRALALEPLEGRALMAVSGLNILAPTAALPVTITSLPGSVQVQISYTSSVSNSNNGTTGTAVLLDPLSSNSIVATSGVQSLTTGSGQSATLTIPLASGLANRSYIVSVTVNAPGGGQSSETDSETASVILNVVNIVTPTVTVAAPGKTYDGLAYALATASVSPDSYPGAASYSYYNSTDTTLSNPLPGAPTAAGDYLVKAHIDAVAGQYNAAASAAVPFSIARRQVTVTADAQGKTYGDADPALTYRLTAGSPVGSDGFTGALSRAAGEDAGSYAIGQGDLTLGDNYELSFVGADLTIARRQVTVTADAQGKTYGDADPALTYRLTAGSPVGSDGFTGALSRAAGEDAGSYAIGQGDLTLGNNYELTFVAADLTITQRVIGGQAVTQSALNVAKMGTLDFTITSGELIDGETLSVFNGATFTLTIGTTTYSVESTAVASADGSVLYVGWRMSEELKAALATYLASGAKSASTAGTVGLTVSASTLNYSFSDDFITRLFSTGK